MLVFIPDYIYIAATDSVKLICHAREVFPEEGFLRGPILQRNGAWKSFGGSVLK